MRFDLTKYGAAIGSFELIELVGRDSLDALARCAPPGAVLSPMQINLRHLNVLVAQSLAAVDDKPVERPYGAWETWSLRTQDFVIGAFNRLNNATPAETAAFLDANKAGPRFDLSDVARVGVQSFELAELSGKDRIVALDAAKVAESRSGTAGALQTDALIAYSIVKIDDKPVERPFAGWSELSMRTQEFFISAYNRLNGASGVEMDDFFARSFGARAEASASSSSVNGPGSPGT